MIAGEGDVVGEIELGDLSLKIGASGAVAHDAELDVGVFLFDLGQGGEDEVNALSGDEGADEEEVAIWYTADCCYREGFPTENITSG